ncbi:protein MOR1-like isoform X3 [Arachis hypogaea]
MNVRGLSIAHVKIHLKALRKMIEPFCLKQGLHDHHQQNSMDHQLGLYIHEELIDFLKETGLQSSAAAIRNASTKLLGVLHRFVSPDIKGFPTDVKPAMLKALDTE